LAAAACLPLAAFAQRATVPPFEDAPMPPRIDEVTPNERARSSDAAGADNPNRARLAPLPEDRVDEVIVTGEQPWRNLPDLGSAWRAQEEAELERRRYVFSLFRRDETQPAPLREAPFLVNRDGLPSAEPNIFRFRFGRRDRGVEDSEEP
jgi:hypothetical protein